MLCSTTTVPFNHAKALKKKQWNSLQGLIKAIVKQNVIG